MTSIKTTVMIILMIIILCRNAFTQNPVLDSITQLEEFENIAEKGQWEIAKQKKGITLSYRTLKVNDTLNTRELAVNFTISASNNRFIEFIKNPVKVENWNEGVRQNKLLESGDSTWVSSTIFDIPYPFPQQELVSRYTIHEEKGTMNISICSEPNYIAIKKGYNREKHNWGRWQLQPKSKGEVEVTFSAVSLSNSSIPRFIKDPILKRKLVNSFIKLKDQLESKQYTLLLNDNGIPILKKAI